jgi:peptidoglycan hydrolase-like protein with peptidoglycan-binding domain
MTRFSRYRTTLLAVCLGVPLVTGCGSADPSRPGATEPAAGESRSNAQTPVLGVQAVTREIGPGDEGSDVAAVYSYLRSYGYLPNPELEKSYPYWAPLVEREASDPTRFGPELEKAVRIYQGYVGVSQTGIVDRATLDWMKQPRCSHPENEFAMLDKREKWNTDNATWPLWTKTNLTYQWAVSNGQINLSIAQTNAAFTAAFTTWAQETGLNFSVATGASDYIIRFYPNGTAPSGWYSFPTDNSVVGNTPSRTTNNQFMSFNGSISWTQSFLQMAATHEIGHSLGLAHSGITSSMRVTTGPISDTPIMFFRAPVSFVPTIDDRSSITTRYTVWKQLNGAAVDIAVGGSDPTSPVQWVTSGSNSVWKYNGDGVVPAYTQAIPSDGVAIAVTEAGVPWVVSSSNQVFRRNSSSATSGSWGNPVGGARDIGIGGTGSSEAIWTISTDSTGDGNFAIQRWTGTNPGSFITYNPLGSAVRISVDGGGRPWVVRADGTIWTLDSTGAWFQMTPGTSCATDIGVGHWGGTYVTGCSSPNGADFDIWSLDVNLASTPGAFGNVDLGTAVAVTTWRPLDGWAHAIAVGPDGRPYAVQSSGAIFGRRSR